jgi:hypothetical protein
VAFLQQNGKLVSKPPFMDKCKEYIKQLADIRKVPQFFYCSDISRYNLLLLRNEIRKHTDSGAAINEIDFILNSGGGDADAAYKIIRLLKRRFSKVNIIVPIWAKSAATLLSLGADEIIMDEMAEFGPLDPQIPKEKEDSPDFDYETSLVDESALQLIEEKSSMQFLQMFSTIHEWKKIRIDRKELSRQIFHYLSEFYTPLLGQIDPYKMGQKNRITKIASVYALKITNGKYERLIYYLANECPVHGFVVDYEQLKEFGVNVKLSDEIGSEYERVLRNLSDHLFRMDHANNKFVGFIPEVNSNSSTTDIKLSNDQTQEETLTEMSNGKHHP